MSHETRTISRTDEAYMFAVASLLRPDKPGAAGPMTSDGATAGRPPERLRELSLRGAEQLDTAARAARIASADEIAWRRAWHAVESCRRVAELAARR